LAVFLGGLGLGSVLLGKRIERSSRPLLVYGNLELCIALLAAVSPLLGQGVHHLYLALGGSTALGSVGATVVRLLCAAVVIGPAAVLMGGTLPAAARAVTTDEDASRTRLALLYALNTTGAVLGALVGPLVLFSVLGTRLTLWAAVCINLIVALVARVHGRDLAPVEVAPTKQPAPAQAKSESNEATGEEPAADVETAAARAPAPSKLDPASVTTKVVYGVAAAVGFAFLALELVWYRMLAPIMGGSSITFGLILAVALAGIGFGGYLHSRRDTTKPVSLELLALTLALEALVVIAPFALGDDLAMVVAHLREMVNLGYGYLVLGWVTITCVVVLPASIVSGYQFPLLFALLGRGRAGVAEHVGITYGYNTIGTITGSLLAGFFMFPLLGAIESWRALTWLLVVMSLLCALVTSALSRSAKNLVAPLVVGALAIALSTASGPGTVWRHTPIGAGRVSLSKKSTNDVRQWKHQVERNIDWETDGRESTVAIETRGLAFIVNGKSDGSVVADRATQAFLGLLPAMLHGQPERAFVVGLGTGMTAGLLGKVPGIEKVTVAELEPSVVEIAQRAKLANGDVLNNPKVEVEYGDGRELMLTSRQEFDVIISEPSNPYRIGVSSLFTKEFYEAADSRLSKHGIFAQWIQGYEIDAEALSIAMQTLRSVFEHVSIWAPEGSDLILIASHHPQTIDAAALGERLKQPAYLEWLRRAWGAEGVEAVLAHHLVTPQLVDKLLAQVPVPLNTDDLNYLEFAFSRRVGEMGYSAPADLLSSIEGQDVRPEVRGAVDWSRVDDLRHRNHWRGYRGAPPSPKAQAIVASCNTQLEEATRLMPADATPSDPLETWAFGVLAVASGKTEEALTFAQALDAQGFKAEALTLKARLAEARGDLPEAARLLTEVFAAMRRTPFPLCDMGETALEQAIHMAGRDPKLAAMLLESIAKAPFAVYEEEDMRRRAQSLVGAVSGDPKLCTTGLGLQREKPVWDMGSLVLRASCLRDAGEPDAAAAMADLVEFVGNEPPTFFNTAAAMLESRDWVQKPAAQQLDLKALRGSSPQLQAAVPEAAPAEPDAQKAGSSQPHAEPLAPAAPQAPAPAAAPAP
jgi:spermidine synthase/MFS family permease